MIIQQSDPALTRANMRMPVILWLGFVLFAFYYTYKAYDLTGVEFHPDFPKFNASNSIVNALIACSVFNLLLAWLLPKFISRNARTLSVRFIAYIVRIALICSVVIYGLVCAITVKDGNMILPFTIFAILGYIRAFPQPQQFGF